MKRTLTEFGKRVGSAGKKVAINRGEHLDADVDGIEKALADAENADLLGASRTGVRMRTPFALTGRMAQKKLTDEELERLEELEARPEDDLTNKELRELIIGRRKRAKELKEFEEAEKRGDYDWVDEALRIAKEIEDQERKK